MIHEFNRRVLAREAEVRSAAATAHNGDAQPGLSSLTDVHSYYLSSRSGEPLTPLRTCCRIPAHSALRPRENIRIELDRNPRNGERVKKKSMDSGLWLFAGAGRAGCLGSLSSPFRFSRFRRAGRPGRLAQDCHRCRLYLCGLRFSRSALGHCWCGTTRKSRSFRCWERRSSGLPPWRLIGRVADPVRPYLVAKKTGEPVSTQIAVYIVERLLDAGSMALIFSIAMIWVPERRRF